MEENVRVATVKIAVNANVKIALVKNAKREAKKEPKPQQRR